MKQSVYVTRNGLLEPLGQSQILGYLRGLSQLYHITLITFEKPADLADAARLAAQRAECVSLGIDWLPQRFHPRPKIIAPAFSIAQMIWLVFRAVRRKSVCLIHARSYIPAVAALIVERWTGVPFVFDMRALWPEELITARRLKRRSSLHRALVWAERICLRRAGAVVVLTHAATAHLRKVYPAELAHQTLAVIPTCVDLDRFTPAHQRPSPQVIGCLGTVLSGWFRLDWLAAFIATAVSDDPHVTFEITTQDNPDLVRAALDPGARLGQRLRIAPVLPAAVPQVLRAQTASVFFYAGGQISELGRSPTRLAEILACGLPVVTNSGVGDVAQLLRDHRVGVVVDGAEPQAMQHAWETLQDLLSDPDLASRCRNAAEDVYSLRAGTAAYAALYAQLERRGNVCAD